LTRSPICLWPAWRTRAARGSGPEAPALVVVVVLIGGAAAVFQLCAVRARAAVQPGALVGFSAVGSHRCDRDSTLGFGLSDDSAVGDLAPAALMFQRAARILVHEIAHLLGYHVARHRVPGWFSHPRGQIGSLCVLRLRHERLGSSVRRRLAADASVPSRFAQAAHVVRIRHLQALRGTTCCIPQSGTARVLFRHFPLIPFMRRDCGKKPSGLSSGWQKSGAVLFEQLIDFIANKTHRIFIFDRNVNDCSKTSTM
jgi:hypothetical protein